ncbi:Uncharacterised protein [Mycobacteroides abscessus subsp. abscessus]|nr:Uncharacterised protein [Mycobacteroides abscessus subsp. abscessus]
MQVAEAGSEIIRILLIAIHNRLNDLAVQGITRNDTEPRLNHFIYRCCFKCLCNARSHKAGTIQSIFIMGNTCRHFGIMRSPFYIAGKNKPPAVHKYLAANLFSQNDSVFFCRAGPWGGNAVLKILVCPVLRAYILSAPPDHPDIFAAIVQPCFPNILRLHLPAGSIIIKRPDKEHRPICIIISRECFVVLYIPLDFSINSLDSFCCPFCRLHRDTQPDAGIHSQETGIDLMQIVVRNQFLTPVSIAEAISVSFRSAEYPPGSAPEPEWQIHQQAP